MARFAIHGLRPGETLYTAAGRLQTAEHDGGLSLSDEQVAKLEQSGYRLVPVATAEPVEPMRDMRAEQAITENRQAAQKAADAAKRVPKARKA